MIQAQRRLAKRFDCIMKRGETTFPAKCKLSPRHPQGRGLLNPGVRIPVTRPSWRRAIKLVDTLYLNMSKMRQSMYPRPPPVTYWSTLESCVQSLHSTNNNVSSAQAVHGALCGSSKTTDNLGLVCGCRYKEVWRY